MIQYGAEEYNVWSGKIYDGMLYDVIERKNEYEYTFYAGVKIFSDKPYTLLLSTVSTDLKTPLSEQKITEGFVRALVSKIVESACEQNTTYKEYLETLPKAFYTQENCDLILDSITHISAKIPNRAKEFEKCCDGLMDYAEKVNPHIYDNLDNKYAKNKGE